MSVENFLGYEQYISYMDKQLSIWGQPCTIYSPERRNALGYEDTGYNEIEMMNSDKVLGNQYKKYQSRIWINFTIEKKIFYKLNWFPEEGEELCMAVINSESPLSVDDYVRTAISESTSIWGDMIFQVRYAKDIGLAQVLQRFYFLKPTSNKDLHFELDF